MRDIDRVGKIIYIPTENVTKNPEIDNHPKSVPDMLVGSRTTTDQPTPAFQSRVVWTAHRPPLTETEAADLFRKIGHMSSHRS